MRTSIRLAVSAACALGGLWSATASAVLPSAVPASNILRFSGATATDGQLENLGRLRTDPVCTGGNTTIATTNIHVFRGNNQRVTLCAGATGLPANIGIAKESVGGSGNGIGPVAAAAGVDPLVWLDVRSSSFSCAGTAGVGVFVPNANPALPPVTDIPDTAAANNSTATLWAIRSYTNCTPNTGPLDSQAGISDVEAKLFGFGGTINESAVGQIVFGVPVSLNLYRALQVAQGIPARADLSCDTAAELDTPVCVPTLTKAQIAGLYGGSYVIWDQIVVNGTALPSAAGVTPPAGGNTNVYVCRRGNTSGTQTFTRAYALRQGCGGSDTFRAPDTASCATDGCAFPTSGAIPADFVYANTSSGNVRDCLDQRDDDNLWAIGVLSTENTVNDIGGAGGDIRDTLGTAGAESHTREFRFVAIDGFNPSLEVAANGGYDMVAENVCTRNDGRLAAAGSPVGSMTTLVNRICGNTAAGLAVGLSNLDLIRAINDAFDDQPHGDGGNLAKADFADFTPSVAPITRLEIEANPVNPHTRSYTGVVNNCSAYIAVGDTDATSGGALRGPVN